MSLHERIRQRLGRFHIDWLFHAPPPVHHSRRHHPRRRQTNNKNVAMRTTSSSSSSNKLYINNALSLTGVKIEIKKGLVGKKKKHHRIEVESVESIEEQPNLLLSPSTVKQKTIELKKCAPLCDDVVTRQVRKIRETVEVEDFERLLIGVTHASGHVKNISTLKSIEGVYEEFFGVYYDILHDVVKYKKMACT